MAAESKGEKFSLLIYQRWAKARRPRGLFIAVAGGVAWWFAPASASLADYAWLFLAASGIGVALFLFGLLAPRAAYVQCFSNYVKIRTPFMSTVISYRRILQVRPIELHSQFAPSTLKRSQRSLVEPFLGRTSLLLELNSFPMSERRLRMWLPWYLFATEVTGFVLVVEDWMALSRQLSTFSDRWVARRQERQRSQIGFMS